MSYFVGLIFPVLLLILTIMHPGIVFITIWFILGMTALLSNYNDNKKV